MANEIAHNWLPGKTLYFCRFRIKGTVYLSNGSSDELWGTAARDADDYDVSMTEKGTNSGHYVGRFDPEAALPTDYYRITLYYQFGAAPADKDLAIAQGIGFWNASVGKFINLANAVGATLADVLAAHSVTDALITSSHGTTDALITSSHGTTDALINSLTSVTQAVKNVYGKDVETARGTFPEIIP